jgi:hypothetical protein
MPLSAGTASTRFNTNRLSCYAHGIVIGLRHFRMNVIAFPLHRLTRQDRALVAAWDAGRDDVLAWPHDGAAPDGGDTIEIIALETGSTSHWIRRPRGTGTWVVAEGGGRYELGRFRTLHEALDKAGAA